MTESEASTFESDLQALEGSVRALESGEVPLDQALNLFEEGMALSRACHARLAAAEARILKLTRGIDGVESTPLPEPDAD